MFLSLVYGNLEGSTHVGFQISTLRQTHFFSNGAVGYADLVVIGVNRVS